MSQIVENDPLVMEAVAELQRYSADPEMQELERRRKLWKLEYYSGLEAAKEEGRDEERNVWATDKIENVLRILTKRFDAVPSTVHNKLHAIHDLDVLRQLTDVALDCQTLDEFEAALNK